MLPIRYEFKVISAVYEPTTIALQIETFLAFAFL